MVHAKRSSEHGQGRGVLSTTVNDDRDHVCIIQSTVPRETRGAHVVKTWDYSSEQLQVTNRRQEITETWKIKESAMNGNVLRLIRRPRGTNSLFRVTLVRWEGLDSAKRTWEPPLSTYIKLCLSPFASIQALTVSSLLNGLHITRNIRVRSNPLRSATAHESKAQLLCFIQVNTMIKKGL